MNTKKQVGDFGESLALVFLENKGYVLRAQNFRTRLGEIDLIMQNEEFLIFVEVKTRKNAHFGMAHEFVNERKMMKIRTVATLWLSKNETNLQPRFDIVEIYAPQGENTKNPEITHWEDAFS